MSERQELSEQQEYPARVCLKDLIATIIYHRLYPSWDWEYWIQAQMLVSVWENAYLFKVHSRQSI